MQTESECLRKPVGKACERAEQYAADNHVVEMGDQEHAVVKQEGGWRYRDQDAGGSPSDESPHDPRRPYHRGRETDAPAVHREQPVIYLHSGWNGDDHARYPEDRV